MNLSEALKTKISSAIDDGVVSSEASLLKKYQLEITLTSDGMGYSNPRVTTSIDGLSETLVTHVKSISMIEDGVVAIVAAKAGEPGAVEFVRGESRRTGTFPLKTVLADFNLTFSDDRKLKLPVTPEEVETKDGPRKVLVVTVKRAPAKKTASRPRKNAGAKAGQQPTGAAQAPAAAPVAPAAAPAAQAPTSQAIPASQPAAAIQPETETKD